MNEQDAIALAKLVGGEAYQSGGHIWIVLITSPDSRFFTMDECGITEYQSQVEWELGNESDVNIDWS